MTKRISTYLSALALAFAVPASTCHAAKVKLGRDKLCLSWQSTKNGWQLKEVSANGLKAKVAANQHSIIFSADKPSTEALPAADFGGAENFPEEQYRYVLPSWKEATTPVALNRAGSEIHYLPEQINQNSNDKLVMSYDGDVFSITEDWTLDSNNDIRVDIKLKAKRDGWYSIASPSLCAVEPDEIDYALIPGVLHGHEINPNFSYAYAYGWGIPAEPVLYRERSTSTLTSMLTAKNGLTIAVTAEPGTASGPWEYDHRNKTIWKLGLSAMNRSKEISPTLYHPVLGEDGSYMKAGEEKCFSFRYTITPGNWWTMFNHVANDVYHFNESLALRRNKRSLTDRLHGMHRYVVNDSTSKWHTIEFDGTKIGAQEYLGGVYKAQKDAMKNADYGAMWMLGSLTGDTLMTVNRLPYAMNFKIKQQDTAPGFMNGASKGQYYLQKRQEFVEEWGPYTEPIATTYYMLMDLGNIYLFEKDRNPSLSGLIRKSADRLLDWQKEDGSWEVAYDNETMQPAFTDLKDLRPTFYGLVIAYRILGDEKYLQAAKRGADWLIKNAVDKDCWLGVCGDTRFAGDFATIQSAQALLDLFDLTSDSRYKDAAIRTSRHYTTSVYTNPVASTNECKVKGRVMEDWQISQSGLSYEHGGIIGSTNLHGPILLASHAGLFVRMFAMTGDSLFIDMARAAAIGRDAFVDDATAVASYYWEAMNKGAGPYPHHAWWQLGWISDYLIAELELRSKGNISFPAGFITPKVGPHRTYGFSSGKVKGEDAWLLIDEEAASCDNPNVEVVLARNDKNLFVMLMNDLGISQDALVCTRESKHNVSLEPYGLKIITIPCK